MIKRSELEQEIHVGLRRSRIVSIVGPRQCGKTTLARQIVPTGSPNYFDLENPIDLSRLGREPMTALMRLEGTVVIDEVQRLPELFPILRVLADRQPLPARFLILGSASPTLVREISESLAGRIQTIAISGFSLAEIDPSNLEAHWSRGGFPPSFLSDDEDSNIWRIGFIQTFLDRDVPQLGIPVPSETLGRFWTMLAHYHGGVWNGSEFARSLGVTEPTARRYLDILTGFYMVRQLLPWHENLKKRQVKSPKVYVRDSGLLHALLGIRTGAGLLTHPKLGASWEGYAIEEALKALKPDQAYFWATHQGAELDLLLFKDGQRIGIEIKRMDAPRITKSMQIALEDLQLEKLLVLYPGERPYILSDKVSVYPLSMLAKPTELT